MGMDLYPVSGVGARKLWVVVGCGGWLLVVQGWGFVGGLVSAWVEVIGLGESV